MALITTGDVVAFFSYSRSDDDHDGADLSGLCKRFEEELRAQSGRPMKVFHDRSDIEWGDAWKRKIDDAIGTVAFFVPVITPSFLASAECRRELESFRQRERMVGRDDLILPIYYIDVPAQGTVAQAGDDGIVTLLKARQYVDWRPLRHRSLRSAKGRQAVTELARRFLLAAQRVGSPAPSEPHGTFAPSPDTAALTAQPITTVSSDEELPKHLVDRDPVVAFQAAAALVKRPDLFPNIAAVGAPTPVGEAAVRLVMRSHPRVAADALLPCIEGAGSDWGRARRVTSYFDPELAPHCESALANFARSGHIDRQRLAIEALGFCGASGWGYQLRELIDTTSSYELGKLGGYVLEALARFVVRSPEEGSHGVGYASETFRDEFQHLERVNPSSISQLGLLTILLECDGRHADRIIGWLDAESLTLSNLAAEVLGYLRIVRAVKPIIRRCDGASDDNTRRICLEALARLGTEPAIGRVVEVTAGSREASSLLVLADKIADGETFARVVTPMLTEARPLNYLAVRAAGRRPAANLRDPLLTALHSSDATTRGSAVLALARRGEIDERGVRVARDQAADQTEQILSTLGLLVLVPDVYTEVEAQLRVQLGKDSFAWMPELQFDVLEVLRRTKRTDAIALADAWRPFYKLATLLS